MTIVFGWSAINAVGVLSSSVSFDLHLYTATGAEWLFYALLGPMPLCYFGGLIWIWGPFSKGFLVFLSAVVLNLVETIIGVVIVMGDKNLAKEVFIASRQARGLPVRSEVLKMMDGSAGYLVPLLFTVILTALWIFLLCKIEKYHQNAIESPTLYEAQ